MSPAEEAAYLRALADDIAADLRIGLTARTVTAAVLEGRATKIQEESA
ncbi:hypothetical protein [Actinotalea sp.]